MHNKYKISFFLFLSGLFSFCLAQPYVDIISFNYQSVRATYNDSFAGNNAIDNYAINLTLPLKIDSQNTIIIRWFGETLNTSATVNANSRVPYTNLVTNNNLEYATSFYASILPIGIQHESKDKKWKYIVMAMPKVAGTYDEGVTSYNFQAGIFTLATKKINDNLSIKGGLFYNREFFGNFFVPIISADWKVNDRFQMYGTIPTFYKFEYRLLKHKLYTGIAYRSYTRSFLLPGADHNYIKVNDMSFKAFVDLYIKKRVYIFAEGGHMISYSIRDFYHGTKKEITNSVLYRKDRLPFFFNVGIAYRFRFDFKQ